MWRQVSTDDDGRPVFAELHGNPRRVRTLLADGELSRTHDISRDPREDDDDLREREYEAYVEDIKDDGFIYNDRFDR